MGEMGELVWAADRPERCFLMLGDRMGVGAEGRAPTELRALPGKWNLYVPHLPSGELPPELAYSARGFVLLHESYERAWRAQGAFGVRRLRVREARLEARCDNGVLALFDASAGLSHKFASEANRELARRAEHVWLCQAARRLARAGEVRALEGELPPDEAYLHESGRVAGLVVGHGAQPRRALALQLFFMRDVLVRVQCAWDLPRRRAPPVVVRTPRLAPELEDWLEEVGASVYAAGSDTFFDSLESDGESDAESKEDADDGTAERPTESHIDAVADGARVAESGGKRGPRRRGEARSKRPAANSEQFVCWLAQ